MNIQFFALSAANKHWLV